MILNVDLGELRDEPPELYALAHLANVACGGHAGDDDSMRAALAYCAQSGALVGAHPSYPDRGGFGRVKMTMPAEALRACVRDQCARLATLAGNAKMSVTHVKAHGALYHSANEDEATARAMVEGAMDTLGTGWTLVGPPRGALFDAARDAGLAFAREGFADRGVRADGSLVARGEPGALVTDPALAARRATSLARSGDVETICVHGDTTGAVAIARAVRRALDDLAGAERAT